MYVYEVSLGVIVLFEYIGNIVLCHWNGFKRLNYFLQQYAGCCYVVITVLIRYTVVAIIEVPPTPNLY